MEAEIRCAGQRKAASDPVLHFFGAGFGFLCWVVRKELVFARLLVSR
jgi:hypothetical protein